MTSPKSCLRGRVVEMDLAIDLPALEADTVQIENALLTFGAQSVQVGNQIVRFEPTGARNVREDWLKVELTNMSVKLVLASNIGFVDAICDETLKGWREEGNVPDEWRVAFATSMLSSSLEPIFGELEIRFVGAGEMDPASSLFAVAALGEHTFPIAARFCPASAEMVAAMIATPPSDPELLKIPFNCPLNISSSSTTQRQINGITAGDFLLVESHNLTQNAAELILPGVGILSGQLGPAEFVAKSFQSSRPFENAQMREAL